MTLEEMIMNEIDQIPIQKQTDLQKNYVEVYKLKEQYRYELVETQRILEKWIRAYKRLKTKYDELEQKCNTKQ